MVQDLYKINLRLLTITLIQAGEHFLTSHMTDQKAEPSVHHTEWRPWQFFEKNLWAMEETP
jgi:6-phosphogluconate dehydrogenase